MAEESTHSQASEASEVVVPEVARAAAVKEAVMEPPSPPAAAEEKEQGRSNLGCAVAAEAAAEAEEGKEKKEKKVAKKAVTILQAVSFKEESNLVGDLQEHEKKALDELKRFVQAALAKNEFFPPPPPAAAKADDTKSIVEEAKTTVEGDKATAEEAKTNVDEVKATAEEAKTNVDEVKATAEEPPPRLYEGDEEEQESLAPPPAVADENSVAVDDDGAKTVEAIEETVVPVAAPALTDPEALTNPEAPAPPAEKEEEEKPSLSALEKEKVLIWGVPLLGDERSDTVLLKFLRARDFKAKEALSMIKNAVLWRKAFGIDALLEEDLGVPELESAVFMHGVDREAHPVCYNVYGELQNKELYDLAFAGEEERKRFLRWRIQYLEKGIRDLLDFRPGGVSTMVQVTDLKNSVGLTKKELRQALDLLQDNYPELAAKQIFINVPWWYLAVNRMISTFLTQRTKSKFVFAGPSKSAETLFKYIAPESVPVQYGGLSKEHDTDFTNADAATYINIKPSVKQAVEIPVTESCLLVWELRVLGWDVTYGAEFVPRSEDGYTVIVQKARKLVSTDEPVVKGSFKIAEAGKVVITVGNTTSKRKKLLYRFKTKNST